jgi:predicted Fe-S protein YdhL (DUF1289 family)
MAEIADWRDMAEWEKRKVLAAIETRRAANRGEAK